MWSSGSIGPPGIDLSGTRPPVVGGPRQHPLRLAFLAEGTIVVVGGATMQILNFASMIGMQSSVQVGVGVVSSLSTCGSGSARFVDAVSMVGGGATMHKFHSFSMRGMHPVGYDPSTSHSERTWTSSRFVVGPMVVVGGDGMHICASSQTQPIQPGGWSSLARGTVGAPSPWLRLQCPAEPRAGCIRTWSARV